MNTQSNGIELVYGRPIDYSRMVHKHTLAGFDSRKMVKVFFDTSEHNYIVMSWHCLHPEYHKDSFADCMSEAMLIANDMYWRV